MSKTYAIDGGLAGKRRLDLLARVCEPGTGALLDRVGVPKGARCLDVGCGGGHVSRELALRAGPEGRVLGVDVDGDVLELAAADAAAAGLGNIEFRQGDATQLRESGFDLAYARFLLSHLPDPARVVAALGAALKPGGAGILEDVGFDGYICFPRNDAHDRWLATYRETVRRRGGDAALGPALPVLLHEAGFEQIGVAVSQELGLEGDVKLIPAVTLERIAGAAVAEGVATADEVAATAAELRAYAAEPATVMGMPPVFQAWGRVSPQG
jgi:SAM-dependent methyltransferase